MIGMPVCEVKQDFAYRYFRFCSAIGCFLGEGMQFTYNPPDIHLQSPGHSFLEYSA